MAWGIHRLEVSFLVSRPFVEVKPDYVHLWQPLFLLTKCVNGLVCRSVLYKIKLDLPCGTKCSGRRVPYINFKHIYKIIL